MKLAVVMTIAVTLDLMYLERLMSLKIARLVNRPGCREYVSTTVLTVSGFPGAETCCPKRRLLLGPLESASRSSPNMEWAERFAVVEGSCF